MSDLASLLDELPASVLTLPNQDRAFLKIGKQENGHWVLSYVTNGGHEVSYLEGPDLDRLVRETLDVLRTQGYL
jgi:hypothetical protein